MPISNYLDTTPQLAERVYLHPSAQVIGSVRLGADCSVWCNTVLRGDVNDIVIGNCTNIQLKDLVDSGSGNSSTTVTKREIEDSFNR